MNYVTEAPESFFGVGQIYYWGSGMEAQIIGYHPTERLLAMKILVPPKGGGKAGTFWYDPVVLGQVTSRKPYADSKFREVGVSAV